MFRVTVHCGRLAQGLQTSNDQLQLKTPTEEMNNLALDSQHMGDEHGYTLPNTRYETPRQVWIKEADTRTACLLASSLGLARRDLNWKRHRNGLEANLEPLLSMFLGKVGMKGRFARGIFSRDPKPRNT